jgi:hypothetical protein
LPEDAGEEAVEALVVARRDGIGGSAHVAVMHQEVFGAEMGVENRGEQDVGEPPFQPVLLVHQFVGVGDAHRSGQDADRRRRGRVSPMPPRVSGLHVPDQPEDHHDLERRPDHRDQSVEAKVRSSVMGSAFSE